MAIKDNLKGKSGAIIEFYQDQTWISSTYDSAENRQYTFNGKSNTKYQIIIQYTFKSGDNAWAYDNDIPPKVTLNGEAVALTTLQHTSYKSYISVYDEYNTTVYRYKCDLEDLSESDIINITAGWHKRSDGKTSSAESLTAVYITSFGQEGALSNIVTTGSY